jgi:hypothetical protein
LQATRPSVSALPTITGADAGVLNVASSAVTPFTPV